MMKYTIAMVVSTLSSVLANSNILLPPPAVANVKEEIAVVWINGALCSTEAYKTIATEFQKQAAASGIKAWVDIPNFVFETPEPLEMESAINTAKSVLQQGGFPEGSKYFVASHSLGTIQTQEFLMKNPDAFEAHMMMGGGLTREKYVNNNDTGLTEINTVPSLSIHGSKDGLYRISRSAEAFYHQVENIAPVFKNKYPVVVAEGVSHASFMDESMMSSYVKANDLMPNMAEAEAHTIVAGIMVSFLNNQLGFDDEEKGLEYQLSTSADFLGPLIEGMKEEGSYFIKIPCYNISTINPDWQIKQCMKGSPWIGKAQVINGGSTTAENVVVKSSDNFHRCYSVAPHHLPDVTNNKTCVPSDPKTNQEPCELDIFTVSEAYYNRLTPFDTGMSENAAIEIKAKLLSTQNVQMHAGVKDPDFNKLDGDKVHCQHINQASLEWGLSKAGKNALDRYNKLGTKMVIGTDIGPLNVGPLWLWTYMKEEMSSDKKTATFQAPYMSTPTNYWES
jgi:hypothetical protein